MDLQPKSKNTINNIKLTKSGTPPAEPSARDLNRALYLNEINTDYGW